jgi:hypothetical protein
MSNSFQQRIVANVIDEASLGEEWGREFRLYFRKLAQLSSLFPNAPLHLEKSLVVVANLNRPNIFIEKENRKPASSTNEESFESILLPIAKFPGHLPSFTFTKVVWLCIQTFYGGIGREKLFPSDERIPKNCLLAQYIIPHKLKR